MLSSSDKLLPICSNNISLHHGYKDVSCLPDYPLTGELVNLLNKKNGCYGFESALHIFPFETVKAEIGIPDWNKSTLWIDSYDNLAHGAIFFAEDIFGGQFCIKQDGIYLFEPETGSFDYLAKNINKWCEIILKDHAILTGYPLAHAWQQTHGRIPAGYRLIPKIPFVVGGEYVADNLYPEQSVMAMKTRANIAWQIRDIPDGGSIQLNVINQRSRHLP